MQRASSTSTHIGSPMKKTLSKWAYTVARGKVFWFFLQNTEDTQEDCSRYRGLISVVWNESDLGVAGYKLS